MNNKTSLKDKKSGKQFSDFYLLLFTFLISYSFFAQETSLFCLSNKVIKTPSTLLKSSSSEKKSINEIHFPAVLFKKNSIELVDSVFSSYDNLGKEIYSSCIEGVREIYQTLNDNPAIIIEISAHCSSDEKNPNELSLFRGETIRQMFMIKGINKERLVVKANGITKLKVSNEQISNAKTKEEKDAFHTLNRRVVFKILSWDYKQK
jgi:outer membrane protein OmpA-like peptidoglycan-associated protein